MKQINLWPEDKSIINGFCQLGFTIEYPDQTRQLLWYRLPQGDSDQVEIANCDPFVIATILMVMARGNDLRVHGKVSPSLVRNLAEFQTIWSCWRPEIYQKIDIIADQEQEETIFNFEEKGIVAFSGGVDSCFTLFRHRTNQCGRVKRNIQAGLMVHGFDIPLTQEQVFNLAFRKSQLIAESLGINLIALKTNYRELIKLAWEDNYGVAIASCLMLYHNSYNIGLLGSAFPYHNLMLPRGSNPVSDQFLGNKNFQIIHDGAGFNRLEKIKQIADWQEVLTNLRVCWQGVNLERNCGQCEKCIRTILGFRVLGYELPACFAQDVSEQNISSLGSLTPIQLAEMQLILDEAKRTNQVASWIESLAGLVKFNQRQLALKSLLKNILPNQITKKVQTFLANRSRFNHPKSKI